jgi:hypothetical protein
MPLPGVKGCGTNVMFGRGIFVADPKQKTFPRNPQTDTVA